MSTQFYGNLETFECEGYFTNTSRTRQYFRSGPDSGWGQESVAYTQWGGQTTAFQFSFSRDGRIAIRLSAGKSEPQDFSNTEIITNPDGQYEYYVDGEFEESASSFQDLFEKSRPLPPFLFDLLKPNRHYRLLTERTMRWEKTYVNGINCRGVHLNKTTHKWI